MITRDYRKRAPPKRKPKRRRKTPKVKYGKLIVALIIVLNTAFAGVVLWIFKETGVEPIALIGAWFVFTGTELVAMSNIKRDEIKKGENDDEH